MNERQRREVDQRVAEGKPLHHIGKVISVGDSLVLTIPIYECRKLGISKGDHVSWTLNNKIEE